MQKKYRYKKRTEQNTKTQKTYRILSIDGGGIRGIIPAAIIKTIEKIVKKPIYKLFDMIAGTSTGGILALGLSAPKPLSGKQLYRLYTTNGEEIFQKSSSAVRFFQGAIGGGLLGAVVAGPFGALAGALLGGVTNCKKNYMAYIEGPALYYEEGLENLLKEKLGGNTRLSEAKTDLFITSYNTESNTPVFFTRDKAKKNSHWNYTMPEIGRATSAAPTFFVPKVLYGEPLCQNTSIYDSRCIRTYRDSREEILYGNTFIDGGVANNNPSEAVVNYVKSTYKIKKKNMTVVSLGTGYFDEGFSTTKARCKILFWPVNGNLINILDNGTGPKVHARMETKFGKYPKNYYRIDTELTTRIALDGVGSEEIKCLKDLGKQTTEINAKIIKGICSKLAL